MRKTNRRQTTTRHKHHTTTTSHHRRRTMTQTRLPITKPRITTTTQANRWHRTEGFYFAAVRFRERRDEHRRLLTTNQVKVHHTRFFDR